MLRGSSPTPPLSHSPAGVILDARFPHVVYKKLMGQPVGLADLKVAFPPLARGFQQLLDFDAAEVESAFGLCMQVSFEDFGEAKTFDLMPGGADIAVTGENRNEYIRLYTKYLLEDSISRQFAAFQRGFHTVCGGECLQLFRWEELELLICGSPVLDFEALERAAQYDDGFSRTHSTITLLWEVIHELPADTQKKFLFFCTGSDRVPIKGLGNLNFVVSRNGTDESRLPSAHTCFNHLLLPEYTKKVRRQLRGPSSSPLHLSSLSSGLPLPCVCLLAGACVLACHCAPLRVPRESGEAARAALEGDQRHRGIPYHMSPPVHAHTQRTRAWGMRRALYI